MEEDKYKIKEFAEEANTTERTARYYVKEELIDPPEGSRRGAFYTDEHVEQLEEVKEMKEDGMKIDEIKAIKVEASSDIRFSISKPKNDYVYTPTPPREPESYSFSFIIKCIVVVWIIAAIVAACSK